jgi:hypothetical protein
MKTAWFHGLRETDSDPRDIEALKKDRRETILSARPTLEILKSVLEKKLADLRQPVRRDSYDSPSWAYSMADRAGEERALMHVIELLDLESRE